MTPIDGLLSELRQREVVLWVEGDRLRYRAAKDALTPELLAQLKDHKAAVLAFLRQASAGADAQLPPVVVLERTDPLPLSFAQQRLWFLHQFEPESTSNNMPVVVRFVGSLDVEALEKSIQEVVRRHEVLRTRFPSVDGQPTLIITDVVDITLPVVDFRDIPAAERDERVFQWATTEARQPFDLANGPILRVKLARVQDKEYLLIWNMHCIVCDGASSDVFYQDLTALYRAFANGEPSPLPDLPVQYADFAHWQRQWLQGDVLASQLNYWKQKLSGDLPVIQLPVDHPRPMGVQTYQGDRCARMISKPLNQALTRLSQRLGATLFMTLLAAFETLLYRYSGQEDMLLSFASAGRGQVETERLIGFFSNTLLLRTTIDGHLTFRELLNRVKEASLEAYAHQDLPFEKLVEELRPEQSQMRSPLFQVKFALNPPWSEGRGMASVHLPDLTITSLFGYIYHGKTKYDLTLVMREQDEGLGMVFDYNADIFEHSTIERMLGHFQELLEGIVANPDQRIADLPLLTAEERDRLLVQWNQTQQPVSPTCIHHQFEQQVNQTPDATAIVAGTHRITYRDLNRQANQLAHYLHSLGVKPGTGVGICLEPSPEAIATLLAVLKVGAVYVPLAPNASPEWIEQIVRDGQATLLVSQTQWLDHLSALPLKVIALDANWDTIQSANDASPTHHGTSLDCACVLYRHDADVPPAGVCLSHQGIIQLAQDSQLVDVTSQDVVLQHTSLWSGHSIFEIWACLLNGAQLVISGSHSGSPQQLGTLIQEYQISVLWLPTRLLHRMVDGHLGTLSSVRQLLTDGDRLSVSHTQRLLQAWKTCRLVYGYTCTENTVFSCYYPVSQLSPSTGSIPIGRPVANTQIYVLDRHQQPVPVGIPGELYLGGDRLSMGYRNASHQSETTFSPNPFAEQSRSILFKTGTLVRYLPDGTLEWLGSIENQLQIQGLRLEPHRIETVLGQHPAVQEAAVLIREDEAGDRHLIAYVVPKQGGAIAIYDLQLFLKQTLPTPMLPSTYVILDGDLPLTADGRLNWAELPIPETSDTLSRETFVPPRNEIELQLAQIWEQVLGLQPVGIRDNFFDLGGHSLLAVQLFAQIEDQFNTKLPLSTLLQQPTVEQLAKLLQPSGTDALGDSLVLLRPGKSEQPIFFIHDGDGEVLLYLNLAKHLKPEHPVYGIQPLRKEGFPILHTRIEAMAAYYLETIRAVQPEGPYLLGGLCAGGVLSFEVARQLQQQGQPVGLVAIMDAADVQAPRRIGQEAKRRLSRFSQALNQKSSGGVWTHLSYLSQVVAKKISNVLTYELRTKVLNIRDSLQVKLYEYCLDRNLTVPKFLQNISVRTIYTFAKEAYTPQCYHGQVVLFRSADTSDPEAVINLVSDPLFGWGQRATEGVLVCDVPGGHSSMLQEPQVRVFAEQLQAYIHESLKELGDESQVKEPGKAEASEDRANSSNPAVRSTQAPVVSR